MKKPKKPPIHMSHPKPIVPRPLVAVFSICLGLIVLYSAFLTVLHSGSMYSHITDPAMKQQNAAVLSYLNGPLFAANTLTFLSPNEFSHMSDVKHLFDVTFITYLVSLGLIIGTVVIFAWYKIWHRFDELLTRSLRATGWTLLATCFVLGTASMLNFDRFWLLFHAVLFPQGNWMFSMDSTLIQLYPAEFFESFVLRWTLLVVSFAAAAVILSYIMERMRRAEERFTIRFEQRHANDKPRR
jgi:integral membrane protein (TIGR01906 family)